MGGKNSFTRLSENILNQHGQGFFASESNNAKRILYPAIVRSIDDNAQFNRIQAEIINLENDGKMSPGKDRNIPLDKLPICIPLLTEFVHIRPKVGECVLIIAENPSDLTSTRFWLGPIMTSQIKLPFQPYEESISIFNYSSFKNKQIFDGITQQAQIKQSSVLPTQDDVSLQGRYDADIVFRNRELELRVGKFKINSTSELNTETPCRIQLKQFDTNPNLTGIKIIDDKAESSFVPYSQLNIETTNFNFISPEGKFRDSSIYNEDIKKNSRLKDFGVTAAMLHPSVFGDELTKLLTWMLQYMLTHIHTPQNPPLSNNISSQLEPYLNESKMKELISEVFRIC